MADGEQAVNNGVAEGSASTATQEKVKSPAEEGSATGTQESKVPYTRFHEVVEQKNKEKQLREQYEAKIRDLESRVPKGMAQGPDPLIQKLVEGGLKEDAARLLVESQRAAATEGQRAYADRERAREVQSWARELERSDPDYKNLEPELEKAFSELSEHDKMLAVSSPKGLEWFYKSVKSEISAAKLAKARSEGIKDGYGNKVLKEGLSSNPKTSVAPDGNITVAKIRDMSIEEYKKNLPQINKMLAEGTLK